MWIVIYIAKNREIAENLRKMLEEEGVAVKIRPVNKNGEQDDCSYDILVTDLHVSQAHSIIIDKI